MYGIALYKPKNEINFGIILRSAYNFNADFICTIENKYRRLASDTPDCTKNIPTFHFSSFYDFLLSKPSNCDLVSLEVNNSKDIRSFNHPKNAIYLFGGENCSLPEEILIKTLRVKVDTNQCLNLGVCASIIMYDRSFKLKKV